ncbi:MAG: DUF4232 domain-containing protein [Actinomycetota bacterium]|nr:DUF4232 domain-containing protein [Actinomycetota bacterium]
MTRPSRTRALVVCAVTALAMSGCSVFNSSSPSTTSPAPSTSTSTTTTVPPTSVTVPPTSTSTTTTTTVVPGGPCSQSSFQISQGRSSGAAGTIALGFLVTNAAAVSCTLDGYPAITLLPVSGTVHAAVTHTGSPSPVSLAGGGEAGFVLEYGDEPVNGQTSCSTIGAVAVSLPHVAGTPATVATHFCPYGQPNISVSPVLSPSQYQSLVG